MRWRSATDEAAIRNHLRQNILPGFACRKALMNAGAPEDAAVDCVQTEMCKAVQRKDTLADTGKLCDFCYARGGAAEPTATPDEGKQG